VVPIIDGGIDYTHPDLAPNMWVNREEIAGDGRDNDGNGFIDDVNGANMVSANSDVKDTHGHGTHVAGIVGAAANNNQGTAGLMWNASLMAVRVFDASGEGSTWTVVKGVDYVTMMKNRGVNIPVANYSLGGPGYLRALEEAFKNQSAAGIAASVAAGNESANNDVTPSYPANLKVPGLISVMALGTNGDGGSYTNYGYNTVHLAAPGSYIYSTLPNSDYGYEDGTSMAAPAVAGVLGLLHSVAPSLSPAEAASIVIDNGANSRGLNISTISGKDLDAMGALLAAPEHNSTASGVILNGSGQPLANASVMFRSGAAAFAVRTDGNGGFTTKIRAGSYTVTPIKPRVDFSPASRTVTVPSNGTVTLNFSSTAQPHFDISGKVVSGDGITSVKGVTLTVINSLNQPLFSTTCPDDGTFRLTTLPPGSYTVRATPAATVLSPSYQSFTPPSQVVTITNSHLSGVQFTLNQLYPVIVERSGDGGPEGEPLSLTVKAVGEALSYQWYKGCSWGTAIPGATAATYSVRSASVADAGDYSVGVANSRGTAVACFRVTVLPVIVTDLRDATVNQGGVAEFAISTKSPPTSVFWSLDGVRYGGCANALVCRVPTDAQSASTRSISVVVGNGSGTASSRTAKLTVLPPLPTISKFWVGNYYVHGEVAEGEPLFLSVTAGGASLSYQWFNNGTPIVGATGPDFTVNSAPFTDSGSTYRVVVTGPGGSVQREAKLKVIRQRPNISRLTPWSFTGKVGSPLAVSVAASGLNLSYQWFLKGQAIAGATAATYTFPQLSLADSGSEVAVTVSNEGGSVRQVETLTVLPLTPPSITAQPTNTDAVDGQSVLVWIGAQGAESYQWYRNGVAIPGATSFTLSFGNVSRADSGATFFVEVRNSDGTVRSNTVSLTVSKRPLILYQQLSDASCVEGIVKTLEVTADDNSATFTWYKNDRQIVGVSGATYSFTPTAADNGSRVRVVVSSPNRLAVESQAVLSVTPPPAPQFSYFSGPSRVVAGEVLSISAALLPYSPPAGRVRLFKDGTDVADFSAYSFSKVAEVGDTGSYFVRAWNGATSVDSSPISVTVESVTLTVARLASKVSAKVGKQVTLTARATSNLSSPTFSYQWLRNGVPIRGAKKSSLIYTVSAADRNASISVVVQAAGKRVTSSRAKIAIAR
jgi:hypothetical protein